jgi:hypothetical protein
MTRLPRTVALTGAAVLLGGALTGCGSGSGAQPEENAAEHSSTAADLSTCKADAQPASKPYGDGFPQDWPFPSGTVVFSAQDRGSDGTVVSAVSSAPFKSILAYMNKDVVAAGFMVQEGETEEHDAEAEWKGNGYRGRWAIRESAKCPGETVIQILSER